VLKRRDLLKTAAGSTAAVGLSALAVENIVHSPSGKAAAAAPAAGSTYTEKYRGRTITVTTTGKESAAYVDGRELQLMKLGEGAYLSSMCHYTVAPTPLHAARTAVDELRGANLLPLGHMEM
jgi:hypothetical protein